MKNLVPDISIIVPSYNAEQKIKRCIDSLERFQLLYPSSEVIFVDDCSTDNTFSMLRKATLEHPSWRVLPSAVNSGSPSRPRNVGIEHAQGKFILFIDADDEIISETTIEMLALAQQEDLDLVRSSLIVDDGHKRFTANKIAEFPHSGSKLEKSVSVLKHQSTTVSTLVRRALLLENSIQWPENLRMGEDTIFLTMCIKDARDLGYVDKPVQVYHKQISSVASSTQQYGERELRNHLHVWQTMDDLLAAQNLSYFMLRGHVAVQNTLSSLVKHGKNDIQESTFHELRNYVQQNIDFIQQDLYRERIRDLFQVLLNGDYEEFLQESKPRLLINGMDLKFISTALPQLEKHYSIRIDQWTGHNAHDVAQSKHLLRWADIIWCEWMLGNAVWYSQHKKSYQKLIVRLHRFELTRDFGNQVSYDSIDSVICVSVHTAEQAMKTFNIPREKTIVIPNYLDVTSYVRAESTQNSRQFNLAMIGIVPKLKGYKEALALLNLLKRIDSRFNLTIFGKTPEELPWVLNDPAEALYYKKCDELIRINNLQESIKFSGWADIRKVIHNYGFVLSLSDLESFHIAPSEGFISGNQAVIKNWVGSYNLYPEKYIFETIPEIASYILENRDFETFSESCSEGYEFVKENYSLDTFTHNVHSLINRI